MIKSHQVASHALALGVAYVLANANAATGQEWGCYDPQPGHPTLEEKRAFLDEIRPLALDAEQNHGVPAPALAAMSIVESGYGFTRIALHANNLFGYKWLSASAAGDRESWTLDCQPAWDENNRYIQFSSRADAVDFVARRLAHSSHYSADTENFRTALNAGQNRNGAVDAWVEGISNPYNYDPPKYVRSIKRLMNSPLSPSDELSPSETLYALSPTATAHETAAPPPASSVTDDPSFARVRATYDNAIAAGGRYMEEECKQLAADDPLFATVLAAYHAVPVSDCRYSFAGAKARVLMSNVDGDQLARWTVSACREEAGAQMLDCLKVTMHNVWCGSSGQFAIAGVVREPADICGGQAGREALIPFRHGVTVKSAGTPYCSIQPLSPDAEAASISGRVEEAKRFGRIAMATREMYRAAGGTVDVAARTPDSNGVIPWLDVVREAYLNARGTDRYTLLNAWVRSEGGSFASKGPRLPIDQFKCPTYSGLG